MDPKSRIRALVDQGNSVCVDANVPVKRYFRSGMELIKMAGVYEEERNLESAFILYFRYVDLFVEKIKDHPEYAQHTSADKTACKKKLKEILPKAELLKERLEKKYQREYGEHVAHQKALEEVIRREKEEKEKKLEKERREREEENKRNNIHIYNNSEILPDNSSLGVLPAFPTQFLSEEIEPNNVEISEHSITEVLSSHMPSRDFKPTPSQSVPKINRDTKPLSLLSANHDLREGRLRTIMVPSQLMENFLNLAYSNTSKNVETCGILAGKLASNKFVITHLLVPQQVGTADSCTTQHEEELFDQQDKYDLITLGWIHTHPTQTAFLSSVDLHTHCSYQLMMPEAVAIVCAPKFKETGYFTLTANHGLNYIAKCRENGFHPHPSEPPLFQAAEHIIIDSSLNIQVIDLRR